MTKAYDSLPDLSRAEAVRLLGIHSFAIEGEEELREIGFLGSLKPFQGALRPATFHEVMACIKALGPEFHGQEQVSADVMGALWAICQFGRAWAVYPDGMLRRNHLITAADVEKMELWLDCISYAVCMLLDGCDADVAFEPYEDYVVLYPGEIRF